MSPLPGRSRFPWEPIEAFLGGSVASQARRVGVHDKQVHRWRQDGLTHKAADRVAIALGLHPSMVWPDWDLVAA